MGVDFDVDEPPEPAGGLGLAVDRRVEAAFAVGEHDRDQVGPPSPAGGSQHGRPGAGQPPGDLVLLHRCLLSAGSPPGAVGSLRRLGGPHLGRPRLPALTGARDPSPDRSITLGMREDAGQGTSSAPRPPYRDDDDCDRS